MARARQRRARHPIAKARLRVRTSLHERCSLDMLHRSMDAIHDGWVTPVSACTGRHPLQCAPPVAQGPPGSPSHGARARLQRGLQRRGRRSSRAAQQALGSSRLHAALTRGARATQAAAWGVHAVRRGLLSSMRSRVSRLTCQPRPGGSHARVLYEFQRCFSLMIIVARVLHPRHNCDADTVRCTGDFLVPDLLSATAGWLTHGKAGGNLIARMKG